MYRNVSRQNTSAGTLVPVPSNRLPLISGIRKAAVDTVADASTMTLNCSRSARTSDKILGRRHAKGPAKHRNERADVFITEIERNSRDSRARCKHLQRPHQTRALPPFGKTEPRLVDKPPRQGSRRNAALVGPFIQTAVIGEIVGKRVGDPEHTRITRHWQAKRFTR